jgi:hypothetical protein
MHTINTNSKPEIMNIWAILQSIHAAVHITYPWNKRTDPPRLNLLLGVNTKLVAGF